MQDFNEITDTRYGKMIYNRNDIYIGKSIELYGEFSYGEAALFAQIVQPGMHVIEVGANIGTHSVMLGQRVTEGSKNGRVTVFEPQRVVYQTLCGNLAINSLTNVFAHQVALGSEPGSVKIPPLDYRATNNFGGLPLGEFDVGEDVEVRTLDSYEFDACHFLKLDVEGMEAAVLRGAEHTIAAYRPAMYVECDRKDQADELQALIASYGYEMWWHWPPLFNADNFRKHEENLFENIVSKNLLCLPSEKSHNITGLKKVELA